MNTIRYLIVGLTFVVLSVESRHLPSYIKPCKQNDPNLNECILAQVENVRPYFTKGIPEFDLPSADPLYVPKVSMNHGNGAAVSFEADFTNIVITGSKNVIIKKVDLDINNLEMKIHLLFPELRIESDYNINGKVLVLPINGKGHGDGNYTNIESKMKLHGRYVTENGKKYLDITDYKVKLSIGDSKFHFDNLFNGNKELNEATNQMINDNSKEIVQELTPLIEETVGELVVKLVSRVFKLFSVDELLLPE